MTTTINASTTAGLVQTADTSGVLALQTAGTTAVSISSGQVATFAQAPVLPAASIPQAALAAGVAGNGPLFIATTSTTTTLANNTNTKVVYNTKVFDTASAYNNTGSTVTLNGISVPAYSFAPNVAGYYQVFAGTLVTGAATGVLELGVYKNGVNYTWGGVAPLVSGGSVAQVYSLVYLNGTSDYIEIYGYQTSGVSVSNSTSSAHTQFGATLVRSA